MIGCGVISDIYIQSLQDKFTITDVVACYDLNTDKMNEKAKKISFESNEH